MLAASSIAATLAREQLPAAKDLFVLSAAVIDGARAGDAVALEVSIDSVAALVDEIPDGPAWGGCRGYLNATREFAWLLLRTASA